MGIISTLRYHYKATVLALAAEHKMTGVTVGKDDKGFFFATGDLAGGKGLTVHSDIPIEYPASPPVATPALQHQPKERAPRGTGSVAQVHAWLDQHGSNMTRKEAVTALAALGINPSTASVQYGAWMRAQQNMVS